MATADTDVAAALVTSSLQSLVGGLTGQASDLRTLASLLGHSPVSFVDIERSVAGMESDVERVAQFLERERVAVAELERLCEAASKQVELADELATAGEALGVPCVTRSAGTSSVAQAQPTAAPPPLPPRSGASKAPSLSRSQSQPVGGGGAPRAAPKPRSIGSRARAGSRSPMARGRARGARTNEQPRPRSAGSASGEESGSMSSSTTPRGSKRVPQVTPLTKEELASVPQYQRGRLTLDKLSAAVADINEVLSTKYLLMAKPLSKLWGPELAQFQEYKQQATKEVKGCPFFCARDVKTLKSLKGSTGTSVLQVLRHVKRVRVLSGGGFTRYVLLE